MIIISMLSFISHKSNLRVCLSPSFNMPMSGYHVHNYFFSFIKIDSTFCSKTDFTALSFVFQNRPFSFAFRTRQFLPVLFGASS